MLNALDAKGWIDAMFVVALYPVEVLTTDSNADLQIASVSPMTEETVDQISSGHKGLLNCHSQSSTESCWQLHFAASCRGNKKLDGLIDRTRTTRASRPNPAQSAGPPVAPGEVPPPKSSAPSNRNLKATSSPLPKPFVAVSIVFSQSADLTRYRPLLRLSARCRSNSVSPREGRRNTRAPFEASALANSFSALVAASVQKGPTPRS